MCNHYWFGRIGAVTSEIYSR
ncbi:unnamed protein product [Leptidea sinapis]|uniref:Uncharacterized protein n=1 Tax=Leptidea sinapis TaxID=189913 RepID=A0A5E4Q896_9NEOP|nr:unnamed protein product [Leptidea sinapis]